MLGELGLDEMSPHPIPALSESNLTYSTTGARKPRTTIKDFKDSKYEDTVVLTNDLKNAAEKCQLLAERLQKKGEEKLRATEARVESEPALERVVNKDEGSEKMEEKLLATTEENVRLRQVIKDVSEINKRWQKYNKQQQEYVQKLLGDNRKLQEEKSQAEVEAILRRGESSRKNEEPETPLARKTPKPLTFRHSDSSLIDNNAVVSALRQSYENAVKENCRLEKELDEMKQREAQRIAEMDKIAKSHEEQLGLLDYQLKIHKEDWEAEKAEKEEEKKKNEKLQEDLQQLQIKCRNYLERLSLIEQTCRCTSIDCEFIPSLNEPLAHHHNHLRSLRRHQSFSPTRNGRRASFVCDGPSKAPEEQPFFIKGSAASNALDGLNNVSPRDSTPVLGLHKDSFQLVDLRSTVNSIATPAPVSITREAVECPGCLKQFTPDQHLNFLDHFEECQTDGNKFLLPSFT